MERWGQRREHRAQWGVQGAGPGRGSGLAWSCPWPSSRQALLRPLRALGHSALSVAAQVPGLPQPTPEWGGSPGDNRVPSGSRSHTVLTRCWGRGGKGQREREDRVSRDPRPPRPLQLVSFLSLTWRVPHGHRRQGECCLRCRPALERAVTPGSPWPTV